jgi:hypothetical protein
LPSPSTVLAAVRPVAGVQAGADVVRSRLLDQPAQLAAEQVDAAVVLHGDLDAVLAGRRRSRSQHPHALFEVLLERHLAVPLGLRPEEATHDRRADHRRRLDVLDHLLLARAEVGAEPPRVLVEAAEADLDRELQLVGAPAQLLQVLGVQRLEVSPLREMDVV